MAIKHYLKELESMTPDKAREFLDLKAQEMKNSVVFAPDYLPKNERVIYVSNKGCDCNDGLTPETAIATLEKVNEITQPGDTVLFERGSHFRGNVVVDKDGVTYAAYGKGVKPILDGSPKNYADPSLWEKTDVENIWHLTEKIRNVGLVHFDPSYTYGQYNEIYGTMKLKGRQNFEQYSDLAADLEFYSDMSTDDFYLYSEKNPGERFLDIELAPRKNMFGGSAHNVTFDNLWITHVGGHGIGSGTTKNRTVRNCVFSWLGGSILSLDFRGSGPVRYGNAVEIYGGCDGYTVENNWMYQIYDTAVTHQFSGGDVQCHQHNVKYLNNLMEYCFWFIEYYNADCKGNPQSVKNIYMTGNFCRFGGYGWGCKLRKAWTPMYCGSTVCCEVENHVAENNIFYHSLGYLVVLANCEGHKSEIMRNNVYVNPKGAKFAKLYNEEYFFDGSEKEILKKIVHEEEPTVVYMPAPLERF